MTDVSTCDFVSCKEAGITIRAVANKYGAGITVNLCTDHAQYVDKGGVMMIEHQVIPHRQLNT